MTDLRPPRFAGDERATLVGLLQFQRESVVRKVEGVPDADARRRLVPTDTTLLWLVKHLRRAEVLWVPVRFAGRDVAVPDHTVTAADTAAAAVEDYRATWREVDGIVADADLGDLCRKPDGPPTDLRWVLTHLLEETARHAGHADILRELIDGSTGR